MSKNKRKNKSKPDEAQIEELANDQLESLDLSAEESKVAMEREAKVIEEEQKVPGATLKRSNSKFQLAERDNLQLFRPEFVQPGKTSTEKIWELMSSYIGNDQKAIQRSIINHVEYTLARTRFNFDNLGAYQATGYSVRDRLIEAWNDTQQYHTTHDVKRVYYMSLEFLMGRMMQNALVNIDMEEKYRESLLDIGYKLEDLYEEEADAGLGNGGLGRLAACFLDSLATLEVPAWGYGIRYDYGIFKQVIKDGKQVEIPDYWLKNGNPWEIERPDVVYPVRFYGHVNKYMENGVELANWEGGEQVIAQAYDTPVPGYNTFNTNNLRLWRSRPYNEFNFEHFNKGDYFGAVGERQSAEYITSVLYPNDSSDVGKELRLKQQYFFCSASMRDIIRRYKKIHGTDWSQFAAKNQVQLNDTHPSIASIELLRILLDEEKISYNQAWQIVYNTFAYTNHTVLPEALEKWAVSLVENLLPRHMELIYLVNHFHIEHLQKEYPNDNEKIGRMSLIEEGTEKKVRMAYLAIVCSHSVNGVAALHSDLLKITLFKDFDEFYPGKLQNKTNGVSPRRWIHCCNRPLSNLISETIGPVEEWITSLELLQALSNQAKNPNFVAKFSAVKRGNKQRLQEWVKEQTGIEIPLESLYDVQVKRIHEYKRQLLNILYTIFRYLTILDTPADERAAKFVPRVVMIGGKAAPGYFNAKVIIEMINRVSFKVNSDPEIGNLLKVVFLPNYCVSSAQIIIPASELSQHISTAGTEASGTSNMKFVMNGCLIIGTMDGANVEIAEECGSQNMFIFGKNVDQVNEEKRKMAEGFRNYIGRRLYRVINVIKSGQFGGDTLAFTNLLNELINGHDKYLVCHEFYDYMDAQDRVDAAYRNQAKWNEMAIECVARSGKFSSDRTIQEYCDQIWKIQAVPIPQPSQDARSRVRSFANLPDQ